MAEEAKWYVAHTYSGYENTVKATIEKAVENRNMGDLILAVNIPLETVTEITDAGSKTVEELRQIAAWAEKPFIVKGIMTVAGAKKALEAGWNVSPKSRTARPVKSSASFSRVMCWSRW